MKKSLSLLLALTLVLSMTACSTTQISPPSEGVVVTTPEPEEKPEAATPTQKPEPQEKATEASEKATFKKTASIEETVLYDADGVTITATALEYDNYKASLKLLIENNGDIALSFVCGSIGYSCNYINEYMIEDGYINCDVLPGKKAADSIDFNYDTLMLCGITEIAEIGIGMMIQDEDYDEIFSDCLELKTSAAESYEPKYGFSDSLSANGASLGYSVDYSAEDVYTVDDELEIVSEFILSKQGGDSILVLEAANSTDYPYMLGETQISVNGLMVCDGPWDRETVLAGKHALLYVELGSVVDESYIDLFRLDEFGQIDLRVQEYDMEYDETGAYADVSITIPGRETGAAVDGEVVYEGEGIRLYFIDVVEDSWSISDDLHLIFLAENTGDYTRVLTDAYGSTSVNGYMINSLGLYSTEVAPGAFAVMDAEIWSWDIEDLGLESPEDVTEFEFGLKIMTADWDTLDEAVISVVR